MANRKTNGDATRNDASRVRGAAKTSTAAEGSGGAPASSATERQVAPNKILREAEKPGQRTKAKTAEPKLVTVTLNVTVPESTHGLKRSVFLTGTLNQINKKLVDWDVRAQQMKKVDSTHWTVTLGGPEGTVIEYKYSLGDWDHVEQDEHCRDTGNRRVTMKLTSDEPLNISDTVHNWRNVDPCKG